MNRSQIIFESTAGFILSVVAVMAILFFQGAPVRVITLAGIVAALALGVAGWMLTEDSDEEDDWTEGWRF